MPVGKGKETVKDVMGKFEKGTLKSGKKGPGKGPKVTSKKQAVAIAMSESGMSKKKKK